MDSSADSSFDESPKAAISSVKQCRRSMLQNPVSGHWCFNCRHYVETDDIFISKKYRDYMYELFSSLESPKTDYLVCICLDCIYYRVQICCSCMGGKPLCMYPLEQWFEHQPKDRKCIDCTAIEETQDILGSLDNISPSQCILQCHTCCKFKFVCSFSVFSGAYGDKARRVIKDLSLRRDRKLYKRTICLECRLAEDVDHYRKSLRDRYHSKISKEPALSEETSIISGDADLINKYFGSLSYASVVSGDYVSAPAAKLPKIDLTQEAKPCEEEHPESFLCTMKDYVSGCLIKVLEAGLIALRQKTELEAKLGSLPDNMWDSILQRKMQFTTHMLSMQGNGSASYTDPETRWVYTSIYTPVHASMVYDTFVKGKFSSLFRLLEEVRRDENKGTNVCCFGAGPGSEVVGLHPFLGDKVTYHLLDNCSFWEHNARSLLQQGLGLQVTFTGFDVQRKLRQEVVDLISKAKLLTFVKFVSAVQNLSDAVQTLRSIFETAKPGARFLIVDNSQPQIKNYVESLVFPDRNFKDKGSYKENAKYRMYTSYGEYRFDVAEVMESHEEICQLMSLVMEWVERPPLVDVRVYIFVVEKK